MSAPRRRSPCVGICSTTYGDLVCRGCKRFAHEIVGWNGFDHRQRELIGARLTSLKEGAIGHCVRVEDAAALEAEAKALDVPRRRGQSRLALAYEVLARLPGGSVDLTPAGLASAQPTPAPTVETLLKDIDREFYQRSLAAYERSFHIPVS